MKVFNKINFRKGWWKPVIAAILCIGVIVGAGFGIASLVKPDKVDNLLTYSTLSITKFHVGGLDGNGNYMNTDQSIYTKDAFECQGLNCTLDFDNEISYQVYFYDQNNEFVHTTGKLTGAFVQDSIPFFAKYARIVITPNDDNKVSMLEVMKYAKQLDVKVYREQGFKNYSEDLAVIEFSDSKLNNLGEVVTQEGSCVVKKINVSSYSEAMIFKYSGDASSYWISFYNASNNFLGQAPISLNSTIFTSSEGVIYSLLSFKNVSFEHVGEASGEVCFVRFATSEANPIHIYCR